MVFFKFKMADGRHTETRFLAITLQPDCPISVNYCVGKQFFDRISAMGRITDVPQNVYFVFLTKFGLRRTAAFVSSPVCAMQAIQTGETYCHCQAVLTECISTIFAARNNTGGRKLEQYPDTNSPMLDCRSFNTVEKRSDLRPSCYAIDPLYAASLAFFSSLQLLRPKINRRFCGATAVGDKTRDSLIACTYLRIPACSAKLDRARIDKI